VKVSEIFYSIQGEGTLAGQPSVFIRLAGCPLRCRWCDTKYAWDVGAACDHDVSEIVEHIRKQQCSHVVITGGEPFINSRLPELTARIKVPGRHITIETCGIEFVDDLNCDLMSISPHLSNSTPTDPASAVSHERRRLNLPALNNLINRYNYQLKFVVENRDDIDEIKQLLTRLAGVDQRRVMLMPQATNRDEYLRKVPLVAELCKQTGWRFSPRLQLLLESKCR